MQPTSFKQFCLSYPGRLAMPIGVYAGLDLIGATVRQAVTDASAQTEAVLALHDRFATPVMLTAMDLSAEAESFGCVVRMSDEEIPTITGRRVTTIEEIQHLPDPQPGDLRTAVHLETARRLAARFPDAPVLGGMIGPFSLAGRIFGVSELLEMTITDPGIVVALLEKVTRFLSSYASAFCEAGAIGVIMAEPAAGLLSPRSLARFSSEFIHKIVSEVQTERFAFLLHNCGARLAHLPNILAAGPNIFHFGAPMDICGALQQVDPQTVICGNLDPTSIFFSSSPEETGRKTRELLGKTQAFPNFVISSGCDLPPGTPIANLEAFYRAVRE